MKKPTSHTTRFIGQHPVTLRPLSQVARKGKGEVISLGPLWWNWVNRNEGNVQLMGRLLNWSKNTN